MAIPVEENKNEGGGAGGNATGKDLIPGVLNTTTYKIMIVVLAAVATLAIVVALFG